MSRPRRTPRRRTPSSNGSACSSTSVSSSTDLEIAASAWERSVGEVVAGDADVRSYVERLEQRYDEANGIDAGTEPGGDGTGDEEDWLDEDDLPSGESLAEDFERYLRDQSDE